MQKHSHLGCSTMTTTKRTLSVIIIVVTMKAISDGQRMRCDYYFFCRVRGWTRLGSARNSIDVVATLQSIVYTHKKIGTPKSSGVGQEEQEVLFIIDGGRTFKVNNERMGQWFCVVKSNFSNLNSIIKPISADFLYSRSKLFLILWQILIAFNLKQYFLIFLVF